jgi:hypothetical protein
MNQDQPLKRKSRRDCPACGFTIDRWKTLKNLKARFDCPNCGAALRMNSFAASVAGLGLLVTFSAYRAFGLWHPATIGVFITASAMAAAADFFLFRVDAVPAAPRGQQEKP